MVRRRQAAGGGGGGRRECTTKNKNPTQRCGEKHPWVGTTGAGQNCPERESESPGKDIIFEDLILVLTSICAVDDVSNAQRMPMHMQSPSVNKGISVVLFLLSKKAMFHQSVPSVKKEKKQVRNLRRAPCRKQSCAIHRSGPPRRNDGSILLGKPKRLHWTYPTSPCPLPVLASSLFVPQLLSK